VELTDPARTGLCVCAGQLAGRLVIFGLDRGDDLSVRRVSERGIQFVIGIGQPQHVGGLAWIRIADRANRFDCDTSARCNWLSARYFSDGDRAAGSISITA
jgi:hypothetical protein